MPTRRSSLLALISFVLAAACGGGASQAASSSSTVTGAPPSGTITATDTAAGAPADLVSIQAIAGAPGTPAPATSVSPVPTGGSGSNRFEMGAGQGLYVVDPAAGEPTVEGYVVVTWGPVTSGGFIPPPDAAVTLNGVPLLRDPNLNGAYWRVDPAGPQPQVGSGGELVLVATATVSGTQLQRTLVLPCPSDIDVTIGLGSGGLYLSSSSDIASANPGDLFMASFPPTATLYGYDPATRAISTSGPAIRVAGGALSVGVPLTPTSAPDYLVDLRWPGHFILDGQTGGFCGLAKRWAFSIPASAPVQ